MVTKKQLEALARGRAIRCAKNKTCKRSTKRTGEDPEKENKEDRVVKNVRVEDVTDDPEYADKEPDIKLEEEGAFKKYVVGSVKYIASAMKEFLSYIGKSAGKLLKGPSDRLVYMRKLLKTLNNAIHNIQDKPKIPELTKLYKNAKALLMLTILEKEENPKLPRKFVRDICIVATYIDGLCKSVNH